MISSQTKLLIPETIQSSAMDCGPAALKSLFSGFRIAINYARLREVCQTDVDGTSIDALEQVANNLGLNAEQIMLPQDYLFESELNSLPALIVIKQADGNTHFNVVWARFGKWLQIMDPATGRRWISKKRFAGDIYNHSMVVDSHDYRAWATSPESISVLRIRLNRLGLSQRTVSKFIDDACDTENWRGVAQLDAAIRMLRNIKKSELRPGKEVEDVLEKLLSSHASIIPDIYWVARPREADNADQLIMTGAVLLRINGQAEDTKVVEPGNELVNICNETQLSERGYIANLVFDGARLAPMLLLIVTVFLAIGLVIEALLFRAILSVGDTLIFSDHRSYYLVAVVVFVIVFLAMEFMISHSSLRFGRHLELKMRMALLKKIPRLNDSYFSSRLSSDMAERGHSTHLIRDLPKLLIQLLRVCVLAVFTVVGMILLDSTISLIAIGLLLSVIALPFVFQPFLVESELRMRSQAGGLARFYLDSLLGLAVVRAHNAEAVIERQYEGRVAQWCRSSIAFGRTKVFTEGISNISGFLLVACIVYVHMNNASDSSVMLLLVYWALQLPPLTHELVSLIQQLAVHRNVTTRLLEPLSTPDDTLRNDSSPSNSIMQNAMSIEANNVAVQVSGHQILNDCTFKVSPGEHVAIVGASGAGKSCLVGLLLGWYKPVSGEITINENKLTGKEIDIVRRHTAWVEPAVHLWSNTFLNNICYGISSNEKIDVSSVIKKSYLQSVLAKLPEGLQTLLGEAGSTVSGGEGQRLRLARALTKNNVQLAILDEPFRGLERELRRSLLNAVRQHWHKKTLLCISHDIADTLQFSRVLVVDQGTIVEDGLPQELYSHTNSHYRKLFEADKQTRQDSWFSGLWRQISLHDKRLHELPKRNKKTLMKKQERTSDV